MRSPRELFDFGVNWLRSPPNRNVEGKSLSDVEPSSDSSTYHWPRWRGSVRRVADLSLVLQESLGSTVEKPIKVRWSANFAHEYEPHDFVERVEESRLSRAELIEIRVADESISATVKFSGLKGEPGAELAVVGPGHEEQFASLKEAVELGEWRPISSERLVLVAAATAYLIFLPALMVSPSPNSMLLSLLAGLGLGTVFGLVALAYVAAANFAIRSLMPPLEIRRAGIQSFDILTTTLKWAIAVVPAMFAIAAGVSRWIG